MKPLEIKLRDEPMTLNEYGLNYDPTTLNDVRAALQAPAVPQPARLGYDTDISLANDRIVWHEAAHALVGHRLGMKVQFIDMTGLLIPSPVCGLDIDTVPEADRVRATGITALAGPVGEVYQCPGRQVVWRQDGEVARTAAKSLGGDTSEQMLQLIGWAREAHRIIDTDKAYKPLVMLLQARRMLTGAEFEEIVNARS